MIAMAEEPKLKPIKKRIPAPDCRHCQSDQTTVGSSGSDARPVRWIYCHNCRKWFTEARR